MRYFILDQSCGQTDWQIDTAIPEPNNQHCPNLYDGCGKCLLYTGFISPYIWSWSNRVKPGIGEISCIQLAKLPGITLTDSIYQCLNMLCCCFVRLADTKTLVSGQRQRPSITQMTQMTLPCWNPLGWVTLILLMRKTLTVYVTTSIFMKNNMH